MPALAAGVGAGAGASAGAGNVLLDASVSIGVGVGGGRAGFDAALDELRTLSTNADGFLLDLERRERARSGIESLKWMEPSAVAELMRHEQCR